MGKPKSNQDQAAQPGTVTYNIDITLPVLQSRAVIELAPDEESDSRSVAAVSMGLMLDLVEGGIMLSPETAGRLREAFGRTPCQDEIVEQAERGLGRIAGKLSMVVTVDPAYEDLLRQSAEFNGCSIEQLIQNSWSTAWDSGWLYEPKPPLNRVLLTDGQKAELVEMLGRDFANGSELMDAIKEVVPEGSFLGAIR